MRIFLSEGVFTLIDNLSHEDKGKGVDDDSRLMMSIKKGDRAAFQTLFRKYSRPLHHFVFRFVGNAAVAEEMVQEIFFKIYRAADKYEPRGRFTTYLYRVATNHCLNEVRKADYREKFDSLDQAQSDDERGGIVLPDKEQASADVLFWAQTMAHKLQELLVELPENQRVALLLNRLEGLSYQEIADVLDVSVGAVKSLLHRARHTLRDRLEEWEKKHEETDSSTR